DRAGPVRWASHGGPRGGAHGGRAGDRRRDARQGRAVSHVSRDLPILSLRGVTRVYGEGDAEVRALDGIDLDVRAGEFIALMGPSGSGKSTCLNVLGCLDVPDQGSYLFREVEVTALDEDQRALLRRHYLGFVFQGFNLLARTS